MATEIERRFLIASAADLPVADRVDELQQGYLAVHEDSTQVRVRRTGAGCVLTIKRGSGETRFEEELDIDCARFDALWPLTEGRRVSKRRHVLESGELTFEIDVYQGDLDGLVIAEVEFPSEDESRAFEPPEWFGRELTGEEAYSNVSLALDGPPAGRS